MIQARFGVEKQCRPFKPGQEHIIFVTIRSPFQMLVSMSPSSSSLRCPVPGVTQAVLLVLSVAERALAAYGMRPGQRDVLFQQHSQDLIVVPVGCQDDRGHVHGG